MKPKPRPVGREAGTRAEAPVASCTACPVCGSEECLVLEELGTYCSTMTAASVAEEETEEVAVLR